MMAGSGCRREDNSCFSGEDADDQIDQIDQMMAENKDRMIKQW